MGRLCSYQQKAPPSKNMRASVLCFAFFTSNQIPFALGSCPLSPECAFRAAQTCHNEDTVRSFTQESNQPLGRIICISESGLIESLSYLFVCFFTNVGFSWKTGHYACVSLDHALAAKATSRRSQIE